MKRVKLTSLITVVALLMGVATATAAITTVAIDLDPNTLGIQSTLVVDPGDSFTIDVVLTGDGVATIDAFAFAADFNDLGAVLGLGGMHTAGTIAGLAPLSALDAFTAGPVVPTSPLMPSGFPFPITPGFGA